MFKMCYDIQVGHYRLSLLESVEIHKSVDLLADTAVITLPGVVYNTALEVEDKIKVGDRVMIRLGYDDELTTEFEGYLWRMDTDDGSLTLNCEDDLFLLRTPVPDKQLTSTSAKEVAEYLLKGTAFKLNCTCSVSYEKFVIKDATILDVLKKLQEDTKANVYMRDGQLNIHHAYTEHTGKVAYDFSRNIEFSDLKYRREVDRKFEVLVEGITLDGKRKRVTVGTTGGEKRTIKVYNVLSETELRKRGEEELKYLTYDGYEGSITAWLIPYVEPGYTATLRDREYEYKNGTYYVVSVTTAFSEDGGVRRVELGHKLA